MHFVFKNSFKLKCFYMNKGLVSNIQRFSLDDGPGIRTTVFFKGCSLRCAWCHNPECFDTSPVLQFFSTCCRSCGKCAASCPNQAHHVASDIHVFNRDVCAACGKCVSVCRKGALKLVGQAYHPVDLFKEIIKDRHYFRTSGGGVTFSGGEPALMFDNIIEVARLCKTEGIHTAIDTAGNVPFQNYESLLPYISLFLYDIKCIDDSVHKRWTKAGNRLILDNIRILDREKVQYIIRVPVINLFNANFKEQESIAQFLASLSNPGLIQLLPYHGYGAGKYEATGLANETKDYSPPTREFMEKILQNYLRLGLNAEIS